MDKDFLHKAVTLDNGQVWYITDETVQNDEKYYLAVRLDENEDPTEESKILKEIRKDDHVYLDDQIEQETYEFLSAIFITNLNNNSEKIIKGLKEEVE